MNVDVENKITGHDHLTQIARCVLRSTKLHWYLVLAHSSIYGCHLNSAIPENAMVVLSRWCTTTTTSRQIDSSLRSTWTTVRQFRHAHDHLLLVGPTGGNLSARYTVIQVSRAWLYLVGLNTDTGD